MDQTSNQTKTQPGADGPQGLGAEHWRGLARLAEMAGAIETALKGPLGAPATEIAQTAGEVYTRHDLPGLAREAIETLAAWRDSGLLQAMRDNAQPIAEILTLLAPLTGELMAGLRDLPVETLREEMNGWRTLYAKLKAARAFVDGDVADILTNHLVEAGRFWQKNNLEAALGDLLSTVARLHESGMLARLRGLADYLDNSVRDIGQSALMTDLIKAADQTQLHRVTQLIEGLDQAMDDASRDERHLGGTGGLLHLLRDKQIQKGLRTLFILPIYLDQMQRH